MKNYNKNNILLIGEYPPPHAGIGVQTKKLYEIYINKGVKTELISLTPPDKGVWSVFNNVLYLRGVINLLRYFFNLNKVCKSEIVHILSSSGFNFFIFTIPAILMSKLFNKKSIVHYHGGGAKRFFENKNYLIELLKRYVDLIVVPSGFLEKVFADFNLPSITIPNIIDLNEFQYKKRDSINPKVLSVRNFTPVYNIPCVIKSFKILLVSLQKFSISGI